MQISVLPSGSDVTTPPCFVKTDESSSEAWQLPHLSSKRFQQQHTEKECIFLGMLPLKKTNNMRQSLLLVYLALTQLLDEINHSFEFRSHIGGRMSATLFVIAHLVILIIIGYGVVVDVLLGGLVVSIRLRLVGGLSCINIRSRIGLVLRSGLTLGRLGLHGRVIRGNPGDFSVNGAVTNAFPCFDIITGRLACLASFVFHVILCNRFLLMRAIGHYINM